MEPHRDCLRNDDIVGEKSSDPLRRKIQEGANPVNGFGPYGADPTQNSQEKINSTLLSSAIPKVALETSLDFLSASCDSSSNNGNCLDSLRKKSVSNFENATSDAGYQFGNEFVIQNEVSNTAQSRQLSCDGRIFLWEECDKNMEKSSIVSDAIIEHKLKLSSVSDYTGHTNMKYLKSPSKRRSYNMQSLASICTFANSLAEMVLKEAVMQSVSMGWSIPCSGQCKELSCQEDHKRKELLMESRRCKSTRISCGSNLCWTPELPYSPNHSRASRMSSISYSHDSLVATQLKDDSLFIKEAVSHEVLSASAKKRRSNMFEPEIYSCPVDTLKPHQRRIFQPKAIIQQPRSGYQFMALQSEIRNKPVKQNRRKKTEEEAAIRENNISRKSGEESSALATGHCNGDVTQWKSYSKSKNCSGRFEHKLGKINPFCSTSRKLDKDEKRRRRRSLSSNIRSAILALFHFRRTPKELGSCVSAENDFIDASQVNPDSPGGIKWGKICPLPSAPPLRHSNKFSAFSNPTQCHNEVTSKLARSGVTSDCRPRQPSLLFCLGHPRTSSFVEDAVGRSYRRKSSRSGKLNTSKRALPPLPNDVKISQEKKNKRDDEGCDFASIIEKVKDYGWYWGPISGEAAEKVLSNEPDGSFIVRDSSDYHYIFSLTFRLKGITRHVRIEHDQGNFSFGGFTRFKSQTIVDFIEKAVEHSRSGRYLFFLHRRPVLGPMRVQLLHPVSRFKHVQSLQHLCRFAIVNHVRRDLINSLPLPERLKEYLSSPHYYSELVERCMSNEANDLPESFAQSPISHIAQTTFAADGVSCQSEVLGAIALSPTEPLNLLPKEFSYQFVHGDSRSKFADTPEYQPSGFDYLSPSVETPTFLIDQPISPGVSNGQKNSWRRTSDCQASFYSSQSSYQFSTTASEYSPENPTKNCDLLPCRKLIKCVSLVDLSVVRKSLRKSACICNNFLVALDLEMKSPLVKTKREM